MFTGIALREVASGQQRSLLEAFHIFEISIIALQPHSTYMVRFKQLIGIACPSANVGIFSASSGFSAFAIRDALETSMSA